MTLSLLVESASDRALCLELRRRVFIEEQQVPAALERDADDALALHFLARKDGVLPVAVARAVDKGEGVAKIGRVAVLPEHRGAGIGAELVAFVLVVLEQRGFTQAYLHSQEAVVGFYERLGFIVEGERFFEAAIPHFAMRRFL